MVINEIYKTFPLQNFLHIRYPIDEQHSGSCKEQHKAAVVRFKANHQQTKASKLDKQFS